MATRRAFVSGVSLAVLAGSASVRALAGVLALKGKAVNGFNVSGSTGGTAFGYVPTVRDATVWRTPQVAQDDEVIDLQAEVAAPWSPAATSWSVSGADSQYFYALPNGCIAFNASKRSSITKGQALSILIVAFNAHGVSTSTATLTVFVPLDINCYFVDPVGGLDTSITGRWGTPWRHVPKSADATNTALSTTLAAPAVLFVKAGTYRTSWSNGGTDGTADALPHAGTSDGARFVLTGTGWGAGRAVLAGDDVITGWTPYSGSIQQIDMSVNGGALAFTNTQAAVPTVQALFDDDTLLYPGQWPWPTDLRNNEDPVDTTGGQVSPKQGGMWQAAYTANPSADPGVTFSGTTITIKDSRIKARYGNVAVATLPLLVKLWSNGNNIRYYDLGGTSTTAVYDFANSTVTFAATDPPDTPGGPVTGADTSYAFVGHPLDIVVAGQYALSPDRLTAYAWLPHGGVTSRAKRVAGAVQGKFGSTAGPSWITWTGIAVERFTGNAFNAGRGSGANSGMTLSGIRIRQIWNQAESAAFLYINANILTDPILERIAFEENPRSEGVVGGGGLYANLTTPTAAQVRAYALGKIRWCYFPAYGVQRSSLQLNNAFALGIYENLMDQLNTVHGDCLPLYNPSPGNTSTTQSTYNVVEYNFFNNCSRPYTASIADPSIPRFNTFSGNVFLSRDTYSFSTFGAGEPGGTITRNIFMNGPSAPVPQTAGSIDIGKGRGATISHNVVGGIANAAPYLAATGSSLKYDIQFNLVTTSLTPPVNSGGDQVYLNNTSTPAIGNVWDIVAVPQIDPVWAGFLGPGQIGTFWSI